MWLGSVVGALLLRHTTAATEAAAATVHNRRLAPSHMLPDAIRGLLHAHRPLLDAIAHPSRTSTSASSTDEKIAAILTEVFQAKSEWARTQWTTKMAVVASAATAPRTIGTTRGTDIFLMLSTTWRDKYFQLAPDVLTAKCADQGRLYTCCLSTKQLNQDRRCKMLLPEQKQKGACSMKPGSSLLPCCTTSNEKAETLRRLPETSVRLVIQRCKKPCLLCDVPLPAHKEANKGCYPGLFKTGQRSSHLRPEVNENKLNTVGYAPTRC
jgi:hypothetical protein